MRKGCFLPILTMGLWMRFLLYMAYDIVSISKLFHGDPAFFWARIVTKRQSEPSGQLHNTLVIGY